MGYYDQPDPVERTLELECEAIPGEEDGATEVCGHIDTYDIVASSDGYFEFTCSKCGELQHRDDPALLYPEPDEDWGTDR